MGYIESDENGVTCKKENDKNAFWRPKPQCKAQSCGTSNYPLIPVETDRIVAYTIYFDTKRKLPIWSFSIHDTKNRVTKLTKVRRERNFFRHPCPQLKNDQGMKAQYSGSGWDRGHLSPSDAHRYSVKASKSSNLLINVAPQDPWTNQVVWAIVEAHVLCHNNKYPASLVVTGVCPNSIGKTRAINGLDVPSCFWKMICYMRYGKTYVIGFLAENKKIARSDQKLTNETKFKIFKPVSQATIRDRLKSNSNYLKNPFDISVYAKSNKGITKNNK
jgi:DNA/RNA endonuclease G (NUC1)